MLDQVHIFSVLAKFSMTYVIRQEALTTVTEMVLLFYSSSFFFYRVF